MNISDVVTPFEPSKVDEWRLGAHLHCSLSEGQVVILTCSDYRGAGVEKNCIDFSLFREELYALSSFDPSVKLFDVGDLISGKTNEDTHYILEEVLLTLFQMNCKVIVLGGSSDLSYALFSALHSHKKNIRYAHFSSDLNIDVNQLSAPINTENFVVKLFDNKDFNIKDFTLMAYQRHLTNPFTINYLNEVNFGAVKLSEIIAKPYIVEPLLRFADLVTLDANILETMQRPMALQPQVNGLNKREICSCMQSVGLGKNIQAVGLFNFDFSSSWQNTSLFAQMVWYLLEGMSIAKTRPERPSLETYIVLIREENFVFQKDVFSGQWYFGASENLENCVPCSYEEYLEAKNGNINKRLLKQ